MPKQERCKGCALDCQTQSFISKCIEALGIEVVEKLPCYRRLKGRGRSKNGQGGGAPGITRRTSPRTRD